MSLEFNRVASWGKTQAEYSDFLSVTNPSCFFSDRNRKPRPKPVLGRRLPNGLFRYFLWLCFPFFGLSAMGQANPGNVGTANLTAWFEPSGLTTVSVVNWTTIIPSGFNAITVSDPTPPYATSTNTPPGDVSNYNMTVDFSGNSNAAPMWLRNTNALNLLDNVDPGDQGTFFGAYLLPSINLNGHMCLYNEPGGDGIQFRTLNNISRIAIGQTGGSSNAVRDYTEAFVPTVASYTGNRSSTTSMTAYERSLLVPNGGVSGSTGPRGLYFGIKPGASPSTFPGYLHEFIFYNRNLTGPELNRVHTYLAIKYGITLENTGGGIQGDYTATDGTVIWDASVSPAYHNDIMGLSRDDDEGLLQKQSHSYDDTSRVYLSTLAANNISNAGVFASNLQSLLVGNDRRAMCETALSFAEMPPLISNRLEREWKVSNTNFDGSFSCDFKLAGCTSCFGNVSDLRLLVDDDGDFTNATVLSPGGGLGISINGGVITISGISNVHVPVNATRYLTLGTEDPCVLNAAQVPFYATVQENRSVRLSWEIPADFDANSFSVERSEQNSNWENLETIPLTLQRFQYESHDNSPYPGTSYYRLKCTDVNGLNIYSEVKQVLLTTKELLISPNPARDILTLQGEELSKEALQLFNAQGKDITKLVEIRELSASRIEINLEGISDGVIFLRTPTLVRRIIKAGW